MLTSIKTIDSITVTESGVIEIREVMRIFDGGEEIAKTYHRWTLSPGADLLGQDPRVIVIAKAAWG